jgi:hypothetical protein
VTALDWIIVVFTVLMALWGYAQGLIVGALSLAGFAVGAFVGSRLAPLLLTEGAESPYAPLFALVGALMLGGVLASTLEVLGFRLRGRLPSRLGLLDGLGGGALVACLGLALVWIAGAVALQTPGARELRESIQRSAILRRRGRSCVRSPASTRSRTSRGRRPTWRRPTPASPAIRRSTPRPAAW